VTFKHRRLQRIFQRRPWRWGWWYWYRWWWWCGTVVGGRSRLHLVDLGSCSRTRDGSSLSLTSLGAVITSLLSGQRQVPHRSVNRCWIEID